MRTRFLLLAILFLTSCEKEDNPSTIKVDHTTFVVKEIQPKKIDLESQKLINDANRSGVFLAVVWYPATASTDNYLVANSSNPRQHSANNMGRMDSVTYVKVSSGTAFFQPSNIEVANYNVTIYFKDGTSVMYPGFLAPYCGETCTQIVNGGGLIKNTSPTKNMLYVSTGTGLEQQLHKYIPELNTNTYFWFIYKDGILVTRQRIAPEDYTSNTWKLRHVF